MKADVIEIVITCKKTMRRVIDLRKNIAFPSFLDWGPRGARHTEPGRLIPSPSHYPPSRVQALSFFRNLAKASLLGEGWGGGSWGEAFSRTPYQTAAMR